MTSPENGVGSVHDNKPITVADAQVQSNIDSTSSHHKKLQTLARGPTSTELLASSIFQFVDSASSLSSRIQPPSSDEESRATILGVAREKNGTENHSKLGQERTVEEQSNENQVQLLRMRTRKHEVVIVPDPNFLCCVVQEVGKVSQESSAVGGR